MVTIESVYQYHQHPQTPSRGFKETLRVTVFVRGHIPRSPCQRGSAPLDSPLFNIPVPVGIDVQSPSIPKPPDWGSAAPASGASRPWF